MINILILSVGTRNKIVQYFKKAIIDEKGNKIGKIITTDASQYAPALYEGDAYYIVPKINDENYLEKILDICKKEQVSGILSLIDPELNILANNREKFEKLDVKIIGSGKWQCDTSLDKIKMHDWLVNHKYLTAKSYTDEKLFVKDLNNGKIKFPVFVKPIKGSASVSINKVYDLETINLLFKQNKNLMIQEFLDGQEIGVDVYIDLINKEIVSLFAKKKLLMRSGETDKAISFKDKDLFDLVIDFVKEFGYLGQIDIDIFNVDGKYYISEVNPRFGGGYPHAYESGVDHMKMIVNNLKGIANKTAIGNYDEDIVMMKYLDLMIKKL